MSEDGFVISGFRAMSYGDTQYEGYNLVDLDKKKDAFLSGGQMVAKKGRIHIPG